ncbi:bifunctional adenosylcobinamide kinase/adenosylcobinamide-phosphate guanylyltransferase [Halocynthiibacter namhaensis]|uniref:bifunctional adenosylcobinamide kinase/adenosylcobinamide-phosphate guanylyltransferase n=1 Tax=Halocynthiibacter namhaensis TaxID=1290553 RepID=UPI0005799E1E|nr:bifunctional adenosylcobinamide kinase/adenosylcobinamide-phosphate guanylyltransferase [Halocynthiibacter namhaensis]
MSKIIFVTGGARSGKSAISEQKTLALADHAIYIATAEVRDDEMSDRVALHQARRGPEWTTISEPIDLAGTLTKTDGDAPRLVDCLTLWLTNVMLGEMDWAAETDHLLRTLDTLRSPVVFVSNEVGLGIVPDNKLARQFRDAAGLLNQRIAARSDEVSLVVSGIEMKVK